MSACANLCSGLCSGTGSERWRGTVRMAHKQPSSPAMSSSRSPPAQLRMREQMDSTAQRCSDRYNAPMQQCKRCDDATHVIVCSFLARHLFLRFFACSTAARSLSQVLFSDSAVSSSSEQVCSASAREQSECMLRVGCCHAAVPHVPFFGHAVRHG